MREIRVEKNLINYLFEFKRGEIFIMKKKKKNCWITIESNNANNKEVFYLLQLLFTLFFSLFLCVWVN